MPDYMIRLPWPPTCLSPNARKDRRANTKTRNGYKTAAFYATKEVGAQVAEDAHLAVQFYPPDNRRRDLDNMLATIKAGLDGIALAAGVDDYGWSLSIQRGPKVEGGAVLIHVMKPQIAEIPFRGTIG